jgi:hypothetical protein
MTNSRYFLAVTLRQAVCSAGGGEGITTNLGSPRRRQAASVHCAQNRWRIEQAYQSDVCNSCFDLPVWTVQRPQSSSASRVTAGALFSLPQLVAIDDCARSARHIEEDAALDKRVYARVAEQDVSAAAKPDAASIVAK